MTRVTAIIATYNRAKYLAKSLDSVLGQTRPPDQVIVVNDGSTDGTAAILDRYKNRVTVVDKANAGKAAALNVALTKADGDLIWVFDDDDVAFPDALARHVAAHEREPDIGFTYSPGIFLETDEQGNETPGPVADVPDMSAEGVFYNLQSGCKLNHPGTAVKRACHDRIGVYAEYLQRSQDYQFLLRVSRRFAGHRIPAPTFHYRRHPDPRGGQFARHTARDRDQTFLAYDRRIWAALLPTIADEELLPAGLRHLDNTAGGQRQADLRRIMIAGRNDLPDTLLQTLADLGRDPPGIGHLNGFERLSAWLTFAHGPATRNAIEIDGFFETLVTTLHETRRWELMLYFALGLRAASRARRLGDDVGQAEAIERQAKALLRAGGWRRIPRDLARRVHAAADNKVAKGLPRS